MKASEQTLLQIERALRKVAEKFPDDKEASMLTDIHIRVTQETGELMVFDDDDKELTRCVVEQWIGNKDDDREPKAELFVVDDEDTVIIDTDLMPGLDSDLDSFFDKLVNEKP